MFEDVVVGDRVGLQVRCVRGRDGAEVTIRTTGFVTCRTNDTLTVKHYDAVKGSTETTIHTEDFLGMAPLGPLCMDRISRLGKDRVSPEEWGLFLRQAGLNNLR